MGFQKVLLHILKFFTEAIESLLEINESRSSNLSAGKKMKLIYIITFNGVASERN